MFEDPFGHIWHVSTHIEDLSEEELQKRVAQALSGQ
jgi:PhnB protein